MRVTVIAGAAGEGVDVVVDADPATPVGELAGALARAVGLESRPGDPAPALYLGAVRCAPDRRVGDVGLREGHVVGLGHPVPGSAVEPFGVVELRVVSGPGAGVVHRLDAGETVLSAWPAGEVSCGDVLVDVGGGQRRDAYEQAPRRVARVRVGLDGGCVLVPEPEASPCPLLDGVPLDRPRPWPLGSLVTVDAALLELARPSLPDATLTPAADGLLRVSRPPRLLEPDTRVVVRVPTPPAPPEPRPMPWLVALLPLAAAVPLALLARSPLYLAFGVLSPLMVIGGVFSDRWQGRGAYRRRLREHAAALAAAEREVAAAVATEERARRAGAPDPATAQLLAVGPRAGLWHRRRDHPDHLDVRLGVADLPSAVEVRTEPGRVPEGRVEDAPLARAVPVVVPLARAGVLGIAGPRASRIAGWVVAQTCVLTSPAELRVVVLVSADDDAAAWRWVRWLPHVRDQGDEARMRLALHPDVVAQQVAELTGLVSARLAAARDPLAASGSRDPDLLVVLVGGSRLRALPGVATLLRDGPGVGVRAVCVDADERLLPEECQAVVVEQAIPDRGPGRESGGGGTCLRVRRAGAGEVSGVRPDLVSPSWLDRVARSLAPLRDPGAGRESVLPDTARLLDVLDLDPPTPGALVARWRAATGQPTCVLGVCLDGPLRVDLRRDGPHLLVAGTTGAGKSELLQTLVASLAVSGSPRDINFVLVDYKGGSAFKDCVRLPHTVGLVTDLDPHLVGRALESLSAELRRRERLLAAVGAKDIDDYRADATRELPRLVIVVDEFAALAAQLPDFVTGLVGLAQRGRSLGMHLVLATQRPSGAVSPEIRANASLRIALRVADPGESTDVIETSDAARVPVSVPGRGWARFAATRLVPFQTARIAGPRPGADTGRPPAWAVALDAIPPGAPLPRRPATADQDGPATAGGGSDLSLLVDAARAAATQLGIPAPARPWLAPLPDRVTLGELPFPDVEEPRPERGDAAGTTRFPGVPAALLVVPFGLRDLPAAQAQPPAVLDLATFGHLLVAGAPRSGRSQLLRTLAGALATRLGVADLHLYGLDFGTGELSALSELPHCGAVVTRGEPERAARLLARLAAEVEQRQLRAGAEARRARVVVLLDRWEGFLATVGELDGGRPGDTVLRLLREGSSVGVHLVITGDRSLLTGRVGALGDAKLALRLADRADYALLGLHPRAVPEHLPAGRALRADTGEEMQVALLHPDPDPRAQAGALAAIGAAARLREPDPPPEALPFRVDPLPVQVSFDDARRLRPPAPGRLWALVGVGGDRLRAHGPDLAQGAPAFVVAGPARSGRSGVLRAMAESLLDSHARLVVFTPLPSPLRALAGRPGVLAVSTDPDPDPAPLADALASASPEAPVVVLVDDADLLRECAAGPLLERVATGAFDHDRGGRAAAVALAGDVERVCAGFSGWQVRARQARRGVLLSPTTLADGDLVGVALPRTAVGGPVRPGLGWLHLGDGELLTVRIPRW